MSTHNITDPACFEGIIIEGDACLTLAEISRACCIHAEWVFELVDEGILEPSTGSRSNWRFDGSQLQRALIVRRLQRDLGVNLAGAALALDLLEQLDSLRSQLPRT